VFRICARRIVLTLGLFSTSLGLGQGIVNFFNNPSALISGTDGAPISGAGAYNFALLTAPVGTTDPHLFKFAGAYATSMTAPGRINGGNVVVLDWPPRQAKAFFVFGWPAYLGHDWNSNWLNGGVPSGMSSIASGIPGDGTWQPALNLFGLNAISSGFTISDCMAPYWDGLSKSPASQTVFKGASPLFDVAANACPAPFYQWYFNGAAIPGATDNFYKITDAQPTAAGTYFVVLSNTNWPSCCQTQIASATLTVVTLPAFKSQPQSQTALVNSTVHLAADADGSPPLSFQWFFNDIPLANGKNSDLWLTNVQVTDSGLYNVAVSSPYYFFAITSSPAILTVVSPPAIDSQPQSQTAVVNSTVHFAVDAVGSPPLSFQWFFNDTALANGNAADLWLTNVQASDSGPYNVVVSNPYAAVTSSPAILSVLGQPPNIALSPWNRRAVVGRFVDFVTKADGSLPLSYQWLLNGTPISGETNPVLHLNGLQLAQSGNYSVMVTNQFGTSTSAPAGLNVISLPDYPTGSIVGWGATNALPAAWTNVVAISAGGDHDLALQKDGTVVAWGQDNFGQCTVPNGLTNVIQVAAGGSHSLALKADGSVVAWGSNDRGQEDVPSGLSNVVAIAASGSRSLALTSEGTVVTWGTNFLGLSTVPTNLDGIVGISAGVYHTLALRFDGQVLAWGYNSSGQTSVPPDLSNVTAIAAGSDNSIALKSDGTVVGWGGSPGQSVPPGLTGVTAIAAGGDMVNLGDSEGLAVKADHSVVAWGNNSKGQTSVPADLARGIAVSAGAYHSLALVAPGGGTTSGAPPGAPTVSQPESRIAEIGSPVIFRVHATGEPPLRFQWFFNGTNSVPGATTDSLKLDTVQLADVGTYAVVVTNTFGAVTSPLAQLNAIAPLPRKVVPALLLKGQAGAVVRIDYQNQLGADSNWIRLATLKLTNGTQFFFDLTEPTSKRFYRVSQSVLGRAPQLANISLVPTLTLAGAVSSKVRVEYMNQWGPAKAWVSLRTVTLTNTSQLFFDTTAVGQPPRFWRVVPVP